MGFSLDSLAFHGFGGALIGPCHGEGDDNEQGGEFVGMGDVGILDIEATCPGIGEQALDSPSAPIEIEAMSGVFKIGRNDEQFLLFDASGAHVPLVFRSGFHAMSRACACAKEFETVAGCHPQGEAVYPP